MAAWIAHLRVAEGLLGVAPGLDADAFLVGNIAPDAGRPKPDGTGYDPPIEVTHLMRDGFSGAEEFRAHFLDGALAGSASERPKPPPATGPTPLPATAQTAPVSATVSFLLGYYTHLVTDQRWHHLVTLQKGERQTPLDLDEVRALKHDWYDVDSIYLADHPGSVFERRFRHIRDFPYQLPWFPDGWIGEAARRIVNYYDHRQFERGRKLVYLTPEQMDDFVSETVAELGPVVGSMLERARA